jgi:hypothetical protein
MKPDIRALEKKFGELIFKDFIDYEFSNKQKVIAFVFMPLTFMLIVEIIYLTYFYHPPSRTRELSGMLQWFVPLMVIMLTVVIMQQWHLIFYKIHGYSLFNNGILMQGKWGKDLEEDFIPFEDMERIIISPSRPTATGLMKGILTAGFGQPLTNGYDDWAIAQSNLENEAEELLGYIVIIMKQSLFDYDSYSFRASRIKNIELFRAELKNAAVKWKVRVIDEYEISGSLEKKEKIAFKDANECEK